MRTNMQPSLKEMAKYNLADAFPRAPH